MHWWADASFRLRKLFFAQRFHSSTCVKFLALVQMSGVIAVTLFREIDPVHFGSLHVAMLSMFRMVTLEDWIDIVYAVKHGCNHQYFAATYGIYNTTICKHSGDGGMGGIAVVFFVFFVVSAYAGCCPAACVAGLVLSGRWLLIADDRRHYRCVSVCCYCH